MSQRSIRRAAERKARKLARKAASNNPNTSSNQDTTETTINEPQPQTETILNKTNEEAPSPSSSESTISEARLAANRENAKHSTGPTSISGLAASSQNRTSHGLTRHANGRFQLLLCEDAAEFAALSKALEEEHKPATETETILVRSMLESQWLTERAQRLQFTCLDPDSGTVKDSKMFSLYMRYQTTHKNQFHKSFKELQRLRSEIRKTEIGFEAQKIKTEQHRIKMNVQEIELFTKSLTSDIELGKFVTLRFQASQQNPGFDAQFATEKAKRAATA